MKAMVTGANGHLGVHLVRELLANGYQVRAGIRRLDDPSRRARLAGLGGVDLVQVDLDRPNDLHAAMEGVDVLFHAAAVYSLCEPARQAEVERVSTTGVEAVLRAACAARVRKVVLTSSVLCVPLTAPGAPASTEAQWNEDLRVSYVRAKTAGERLGWRLAGELGLNLVTLLPGSLGGPGFGASTPTTDVLDCMMRGAFRAGVPDTNLPYVDVRDVARAHRLAAQADVQGRFIVVDDEQPTFRRLIEVMHDLDPRVKLPLCTMPAFTMPIAPFFDRLNAATLGTPRTLSREFAAFIQRKRFNASNRKARELLGWEPAIPLHQSIADTMSELVRRQAGSAANARPMAQAAPASHCKHS
jgi:dihydroflavonol-4-reductase